VLSSGHQVDGYKLERQFGIVDIAVTGESSDVNQDKVVALKDTVLQHLMPKYTLKDIFHVCECGLLSNMLPSKNYTFKGQSGGGMKVDKERISVLVCVNLLKPSGNFTYDQV
jgi:hypothetical protein